MCSPTSVGANLALCVRSILLTQESCYNEFSSCGFGHFALLNGKDLESDGGLPMIFTARCMKGLSMYHLSPFKFQLYDFNCLSIPTPPKVLTESYTCRLGDSPAGVPKLRHVITRDQMIHLADKLGMPGLIKQYTSLACLTCFCCDMPNCEILKILKIYIKNIPLVMMQLLKNRESFHRWPCPILKV